MKRTFLLKTVILLCALVAGSSSVWAADVAFVAGTDKGSKISSAADQVSKDGITISCNSSALGRTDNYRFYSSKITITSTVGKINKIVFENLTDKDGNANNSITANGFSYDTTNKKGTWEGTAAASVELTPSAQIRCDKITVSYSTYTATFYVNGSEYSSISAGEGVEYNFPTTIPSSIGGKTFVGWTTTAISTPQNTAPTPLIKSAEATMGDADVTYYAVYVTSSGSAPVDVELSNTTIENNASGKGSYATTYNVDGWTGKYLISSASSTYFIQLGYNTSSSKTAYNSHLTTPNYAGNITSITIETMNGTQSGRTFYLCSEDDLGTASSTNATYGYGSTSSANGSVTITVSGNTTQFHIYPDGTAYIKSISLTYDAATYSAYCTTIPPIPVTITSAEYATYYNATSSLDFSETGIRVFTATDNETSVTLNEVETGKIPANTPVVLYKENADGTAINVPVIESAEPVNSANSLVVSDGTAPTNAYVLANKSKGVGFYKWTGGAISAGKIYLQASASYGAPEFMGFGDATAVERIANSQEPAANGQYYNLNGQRVAKPTKGLYIVNGKKVVVK